jgi:hypothetical protein
VHIVPNIEEEVMDIAKDSWYCRWFFWSVEIVSTCANWQEIREQRDVDYYQTTGTTLCQFMRTTLVWAPFVLLLHTIVYATFIAAVTIVPYRLFGTTYLILAAGTMALAALIRYMPKHLRTAMGPATEKVAIGLHNARIRIEEIHALHVASRQPGFLRLVYEWVLAKKRSVCPVIRFN